MQKYIEALTLHNWELIHEAAKKEASREVTEMSKWLDFKKQHDPEGLEAQAYLVPPIEKAVRYRYNIYNIGKKIKAIVKKIESETDPGKVIKLQDEKADLEAEQYTLCWRILKIHCIVSAHAILTLTGDIPDEYDDRDVYGETQ